MLTSDAPVDAGSSPAVGSGPSRRTRTRAPLLAATMVVILGCRSSGAANRAPNATAQPPSDPRAFASDEPAGEAERAARAERYLSEERWNAAASEEPERPNAAASEETERPNAAAAEEPERPRADGRHPSGPTEAEFRAWDRKDPTKENDLYKWDAANFGRMEAHFHDLECFRVFMIAAGESGRGAAPGTKAAKTWAEAKRELVGKLDVWEKQLFAEDPRILERSKFVQRFLEAHEVVARELPKAYDDDDQRAIDKAEAHWMVAVAMTDKHARNLGKTLSRASDAHCKTMRRS